MSTSVKFNNTDINNVTYISENTTQDSAPDRVLSSFKIARRDGEKLVSTFWGKKEIDINGYIVGTSQADFEAKADTLKGLLATQAANLDIVYNGVTRRYVATAIEVKVNRDSYNIDWAPYSVKFLVPLGIGSDTVEIHILNKAGIVATTDTEIITFGGSYNPKPRHLIWINTRGNADVVRLKNTVTGEYMDICLDGIYDGGWIQIDENLQTVTSTTTNPSTVYSGVFPSTLVGANTFEILMSGSGYTLDQSQLSNHGGSRSVIYSNGVINPWEYQSFIPTISGRIKQINLYLAKTGSPGGTILFAICADNNGLPGTQIGGDWQPAVSTITTPGLYTMDITGTEPYLYAGQRYWIRNNSIVTLTGTSNTKFLSWYVSDLVSDYPNGQAMAQMNSTSPLLSGFGDADLTGVGVETGQYEFMFQEYVGDGASPSWNLTWDIYHTPKYL